MVVEEVLVVVLVVEEVLVVVVVVAGEVRWRWTCLS